MNIYVGNLSWNLKDQDLLNLFAAHGEVASAKIVTDKFTGRSKGFGFVEMPNILEAKEAIDTLHDLGIGRKKLVVKEATNSPDQRDFRAPRDTRPTNRFGSSYRPRDKY